MSQFLTEIAVDVDNVKRLLPKGSFVESVAWNKDKQVVELTWSNRNLQTPYSIATPFPVQMLHDQQVPKGATIKEVVINGTEVGGQKAEDRKTPLNNDTVTDKPVDVKTRKGVKVKAA